MSLGRLLGSGFGGSAPPLAKKTAGLVEKEIIKANDE